MSGRATSRSDAARRRRARILVADAFPTLCAAVGLPKPVPEYRFDAKRRWRFDYAWPDRLLALEVEGGIWTRGRHVRGAGYRADMEKYNAAALAGWRVLRTTPRELASAETIEMLRRALRP